jgi:hypothetical protein
MRTRKKLWIYGWTAAAAVSAIVVQTTLLSHFPVKEAVPIFCNLPLTVAILWGTVYGSPMPPISPDELRLSTATQIFLRQAMSGSVVGALMGGFFAALYTPMLGVFPAYFVFAGWVAGYFCMRNTNRMLSFLCIPLVLVISLLAETVMAWQLSLIGRTGTFDNLMQIALPEAALNAILAPFIYFPLRRWYEIATAVKLVPHR